MEQVMHDTTTVQPSTSMGLPEEDDKVVRELDVYLCSSELGSGAHVRAPPPWRRLPPPLAKTAARLHDRPPCPACLSCACLLLAPTPPLSGRRLPSGAAAADLPAAVSAAPALAPLRGRR
jgi:hypothetical protein